MGMMELHFLSVELRQPLREVWWCQGRISYVTGAHGQHNSMSCEEYIRNRTIFTSVLHFSPGRTCFVDDTNFVLQQVDSHFLVHVSIAKRRDEVFIADEIKERLLWSR